MVLLFATYTFFPPGFREPEGHLILTPPGQCSFECWSELSRLRGPLLETRGLVLLVGCLIRCALRTRYVQLLSGFVGTFGRLCWSCFTIVEMSCNRDSKTDGSSWEKEYPSLTVRAYNGLSWDTPAGYYLSKAVLAVMWQMGIC